MGGRQCTYDNLEETMPKTERLQIIEKLQEARNTNLISYVTSTRQGLEVPMAMDSVRRVYEHLKLLPTNNGELANIDLFIYSNGGDGTVPWRLVTLIREYALKFSVLVPHRAFSAATLTALGADSIVMHPMGMLGPTDPTVTNPFNPANPANPSQRIGISVEDVTAYIALIKDDVGIRHEDELVQAFNKLADHVHPLALGNVKRSLSQSRMMARKLLALHMDGDNDSHKIENIVDNLTSKLFYHGHPINRREAKDQIGLAAVETPSSSVEELMWELYLDYESEMKLEEPFQPELELMAHQVTVSNSQSLPPVSKVKLAFVESSKRTDVMKLDYQLSGQTAPNGQVQVNMAVLKQGWEQE
jgi:hypothetical protein